MAQGGEEMQRWTIGADLRQQYTLNPRPVHVREAANPLPPPSPSPAAADESASDESAPDDPEPSAPSTMPAAFICSITQDVMSDPVMCADGHTYERAAIQQWLAANSTSPNTNLRLVSAALRRTLFSRPLFLQTSI